MGLFGFLKKAVGGLGKLAVTAARGVAATATHGLSEKALSIVKGGGLAKSKSQNEALLNKLGVASPKVKSTESRVEGWGFGKAMPGGGKKKPRPSTMPQEARAPGKRGKGRRRKKGAGAGPKRAAPAAFAVFAARSKELAAEWRALGGIQGTGQTFFAWKVGK